jgi:hypothetical protein
MGNWVVSERIEFKASLRGCSDVNDSSLVATRVSFATVLAWDYEWNELLMKEDRYV